MSAETLSTPLAPDSQAQITPRQLARLIMEILIRNDQMPPEEKRWKVSYYPYQLSAIRTFEIIGHQYPEIPEFARKWNEAIALLKSKAFVMLDPSQEDREDFMMPTTIATRETLQEELGMLPAA